MVMKKILILIAISLTAFNSYCQSESGIYYLAKDLRELYNADTKTIPFDAPIKTALEKSSYHGFNVDTSLINKNPFLNGLF